jgi:hypothetical protein
MDDPACFSGTLSAAEKLAKASGEELVMPDALAASLGEDGGVSAATAEVAAQRRKLMTQAEVLQTKQEAEQAPAAMAPPPAKTQPKKPEAPKPAAKTKTKTPAKTEASR